MDDTAGVRVLHLTAGKMYGGVESSLFTLARYSRAYPAFELHFALCFEGRLREQLQAAGFTTHPLGGVRIRWPWTAWRARRRLAQLLARIRPHIAICHSCWPHVLFAPVVRARGLPLAFWAHDRYPGKHWLERWSRRTPPDLILANSRFTQSQLGNLFPGVRSVVVYQPVAPAPPMDRAANRTSVRRSLQTPEEAVVIVQACRLEPWKGHGLLLDALGRLAGDPRWACWIAGGAQRPQEEVYLKQLRQQAVARGIAERVRFLGQRHDVPNLLAAADIHCQPNTGPEPFGVAFVEALHAGLPVVTTSMGGALEILDENCGILVPPGQPATLADTILRLVCDDGLRARLALNGPIRAHMLCDPVAQVGKILGALRETARAGAVAS